MSNIVRVLALISVFGMAVSLAGCVVAEPVVAEAITADTAATAGEAAWANGTAAVAVEGAYATSSGSEEAMSLATLVAVSGLSPRRFNIVDDLGNDQMSVYDTITIDGYRDSITLNQECRSVTRVRHNKPGWHRYSLRSRIRSVDGQLNFYYNTGKILVSEGETFYARLSNDGRAYLANDQHPNYAVPDNFN